MKKNSILLFLASLPFLLAAQTPVARYTFNNGNANDEINSNNGVVSGATLTTDRFGNANKAYSFDGMNDYITLGDVPEFQFGSGDFSISLWVEYTVSQTASIISKRDGAATDYQQYNLAIMNSIYGGGASQNLWGFIRNSQSEDRLMSGGNLAGAWHHIVLVNKNNSSSALFVDGSLAEQSGTPFTGTLDVLGDPLVLGYNSDGNSGFYNGKIDDIHIYRSALTEQQIDSLYTLPNPASLSLSEPATKSSIKTYPNPSKGTLFVEAAFGGKLKIVNCLGQEIQSVTLKENKNEVVIEENGIYFFEFTDAYGNTTINKVIINN